MLYSRSKIPNTSRMNVVIEWFQLKLSDTTRSSSSMALCSSRVQGQRWITYEWGLKVAPSESLSPNYGMRCSTWFWWIRSRLTNAGGWRVAQVCLFLRPGSTHHSPSPASVSSPEVAPLFGEDIPQVCDSPLFLLQSVSNFWSDRPDESQYFLDTLASLGSVMRVIYLPIIFPWDIGLITSQDLQPYNLSI